jgi:hypothetical protein
MIVNNSLRGAEPSCSAQMTGFHHGGAYSSASTGHLYRLITLGSLPRRILVAFKLAHSMAVSFAEAEDPLFVSVALC